MFSLIHFRTAVSSEQDHDGVERRQRHRRRQADPGGSDDHADHPRNRQLHDWRRHAADIIESPLNLHPIALKFL